MPPRTRWVIQGYKSTQKVCETDLPLGSLSENEMVILLQRLACRHLSEDEIVEASLRKSSKPHPAGDRNFFVLGMRLLRPRAQGRRQGWVLSQFAFC